MSKTRKDTILPKLRFPEFIKTDGWKTLKLDEVSSYENGKAHEQDITDDGKFIVANSKFISTDGEVKKFTSTPFCLANIDDILMVLSDVPNGRAIAKCYYVRKNDFVTVNQRICKIVSNEQIKSRFLFYVLNRNPYFLKFDDGVKQTNLGKSDVLSCPIPLPSKAREQERIADCLSSLDDLISAQSDKVENLKIYKNGLLQQLFPQDGEKVPRLRFPEFKEEGEWFFSELGAMIEEFREKSTVQDEFKVFTSSRNGLVWQIDFFGEGRLTERNNVGFNVIPPNYITYRSRSDDRRFYFNENKQSVSGIISIYYPVFRIPNGSNGFFIALTTRYSDIIGKYSVGNAQTVLSLNALKTIKLPIPPNPKEQHRISDLLSSIDELIEIENEKLSCLQSHKTGLLQQLFPSLPSVHKGER